MSRLPSVLAALNGLRGQILREDTLQALASTRCRLIGTTAQQNIMVPYNAYGFDQVGQALEFLNSCESFPAFLQRYCLESSDDGGWYGSQLLDLDHDLCKEIVNLKAFASEVGRTSTVFFMPRLRAAKLWRRRKKGLWSCVAMFRPVQTQTRTRSTRFWLPTPSTGSSWTGYGRPSPIRFQKVWIWIPNPPVLL